MWHNTEGATGFAHPALVPLHGEHATAKCQAPQTNLNHITLGQSITLQCGNNNSFNAHVPPGGHAGCRSMQTLLGPLGPPQQHRMLLRWTKQPSDGQHSGAAMHLNAISLELLVIITRDRCPVQCTIVMQK